MMTLGALKRRSPVGSAALDRHLPAASSAGSLPIAGLEWYEDPRKKRRPRPRCWRLVYVDTGKAIGGV